MISARSDFASYETFLAALNDADRIAFVLPDVAEADDGSVSAKADELEFQALTKAAEVKLDKAMPLEHKVFTLYEALQFHLQSVDLVSGASQHEYPICLEQRFAAFSDHYALNAINVFSCVFLVLVHQDSKFTFGAHIDGGVTTQQIKEAIALFLTKLGNPNAALTCHLIGGDATTLELGTLKTIFHALNDLNVALGEQAVTLSDLHDNVNAVSRPLNIAYDPLSGNFYDSKVPFSNKLRQIQSTIFYILCQPESTEQLPLHVMASHQRNEFEYYSLRVSKESLITWMNSAKKKGFENNFVKTLIQYLDNLMMQEMIGQQYFAELNGILYEIAEAYKYVETKLNNKSLFFQPRDEHGQLTAVAIDHSTISVSKLTI